MGFVQRRKPQLGELASCPVIQLVRELAFNPPSKGFHYASHSVLQAPGWVCEGPACLSANTARENKRG